MKARSVVCFAGLRDQSEAFPERHMPGLTVEVKVEQRTAPRASVVVDLGDAITELTASAPGWNCNVTGSLGLALCSNTSTVTAPNSYPPIVLTAKVGKCVTPFKNDFTLAGAADSNAVNNKTSSSSTCRIPSLNIRRRSSVPGQ